MPYDQSYSDERFEGRPFSDELELCTFSGCSFEEADLTNLLIADTVFDGCDMRMVRLAGARLLGVRFVNCRLTGVAFSTCSDFGLEFSLMGCDAQFASFTELNLSRASLAQNVFKGADFVATDLSGADLSGCDLLDAAFESTNLTGADFRGALHFDIDPDANRTRGAKFSRGELEGLLRKHGLKVE